MMDLYLTILIRYVKFPKDVFPSKDLCPKQVGCINDSLKKNNQVVVGGEDPLGRELILSGDSSILLSMACCSKGACGWPLK